MMKTSYPLRECVDKIAAEIADVAQRPRREAELMMMEHLECDPVWLITHPDAPVVCDSRLQSWIRRRKAYEPLEYIFNKVSFYSQTFFVEHGALIPRPETELLIDRVLERVPSDAAVTLCEAGVGSGAVSVVLAQQLRNAEIIGVDISEEALGIARKNVDDFALAERIELRRSDLLEAVDEPLDILVSNPPYVARDASLEANLDYEPDLALFGGEQGMDIIYRLIDAVHERQIPLFVCEMGFDQRKWVKAYVDKTAFDLEFYKDLAGLDRGFVMKHKERK